MGREGAECRGAGAGCRASVCGGGLGFGGGVVVGVWCVRWGSGVFDGVEAGGVVVVVGGGRGGGGGGGGGGGCGGLGVWLGVWLGAWGRGVVFGMWVVLRLLCVGEGW